MTDPDRRAALALTLEGLLPIVWMERVARCRDPRRPTREELWPTDAEREAAGATLAMADDLAVGRGPQKKSKGSLAALARALVYLSLAPGGVKAFGLRVEAVDRWLGTSRAQSWVELIVERIERSQ